MRAPFHSPAAQRLVTRSERVCNRELGVGAHQSSTSYFCYGRYSLDPTITTAARATSEQARAVLATRTIVVSLPAGILITVASGLLPALRATGVPPIASVREGALPRSPLAPYAPYIAGTTIALGVGLLGLGMFAPGLSVRAVLLLLATGQVAAHKTPRSCKC